MHDFLYDVKVTIRVDLKIRGVRIGEIDGVALYAEECDGPIAVLIVDQYEPDDERRWIEVRDDELDGDLRVFAKALWAATREREHIVKASCKLADFTLQRAADRIGAEADYYRNLHRERLMAAE
jgi:hypothetical protein